MMNDQVYLILQELISAPMLLVCMLAMRHMWQRYEAVRDKYESHLERYHIPLPGKNDNENNGA